MSAGKRFLLFSSAMVTVMAHVLSVMFSVGMRTVKDLPPSSLVALVCKLRDRNHILNLDRRWRMSDEA